MLFVVVIISTKGNEQHKLLRVSSLSETFSGNECYNYRTAHVVTLFKKYKRACVKFPEEVNVNGICNLRVVTIRVALIVTMLHLYRKSRRRVCIKFSFLLLTSLC